VKDGIYLCPRCGAELGYEQGFNKCPNCELKFCQTREEYEAKRSCDP